MTPSSTMPRSSAAGSEAGASERTRAAAVAGVVAGAEAAAGLRLDDLLIWQLAGGRPAGGTPPPAPADLPVPDGAPAIDLVAGALERATDEARRKAAGLHVTPRWLAEHLVSLALPDPPPAGAAASDRAPTVCDPACGGGAFLLAAARRLHAQGIPRRDVVGRLLWGADIDPVGLAAAEAALALWAGERPPPGRLVVADPLHAPAVPWTAVPPDGFDAVVGNPPFQSQLGRATARPRAEQRRLRSRFGDAVRAYTDTAWLFLLVGCDLARPGGRVVMVQPQSVVAARDAEAVRAATGDLADLLELWVDDGRVFDAAVSVCAPVLERRGPGAGVPSPPRSCGLAPADADGWSDLLARAADVPAVDLGDGPALGERAAVVAGFRDQYYGLVDIVRERLPGDDAGPGGAVAPLVTSGSLDWAACRWGERPARFAKRRWQAPVVDLTRLDDAPPIVGRWVARTRAPKLVVATQTRVLEAAVDPDGTWVPSVPALAVVPADPDDVWRIAAAVLAPAATAWLARRAAGTGLDRGALKVAGPGLAALPLPRDVPAWHEAAAALARHVAATDPETAADHLAAYLGAIGRAYGTPAAVTAWWRVRAGTVVRGRPGDG